MCNVNTVGTTPMDVVDSTQLPVRHLSPVPVRHLSSSSSSTVTDDGTSHACSTLTVHTQPSSAGSKRSRLDGSAFLRLFEASLKTNNGAQVIESANEMYAQISQLAVMLQRTELHVSTESVCNLLRNAEFTDRKSVTKVRSKLEEGLATSNAELEQLRARAKRRNAASNKRATKGCKLVIAELTSNVLSIRNRPYLLDRDVRFVLPCIK
jgi:hypothetical protein